MYHTAKRAKRKKRRIGWVFLVLGIWAAGLWWVFPVEEAAAAPAAAAPVVRHGREVYTVVLRPETVYTQDPGLPVGQEVELVPGMAGELRCTAEVDYVDGRAVRREVVSRELVRPVENRIAALGTAETPRVTAGNGYLWLPDGTMLTYTHTAAVQATAFTASDPGSLQGARYGTVAVDPAFIPAGSRLYIVSEDGSFLYGPAQAAASESMEGSRIDLCLPTAADCTAFGRKPCTVYFLG